MTAILWASLLYSLTLLAPHVSVTRLRNCSFAYFAYREQHQIRPSSQPVLPAPGGSGRGGRLLFFSTSAPQLRVGSGRCRTLLFFFTCAPHLRVASGRGGRLLFFSTCASQLRVGSGHGGRLLVYLRDFLYFAREGGRREGADQLLADLGAARGFSKYMTLILWASLL